MEEIGQLKRRLANVTVQGNRHYNPGWHLALDLQCMLTVAGQFRSGEPGSR